MTKKEFTYADYAHLLPEPGRRRMSKEESEKFVASYEASKSDYERAQGQSDPDGITKEAGLSIITAVADDAERRQKK